MFEFKNGFDYYYENDPSKVTVLFIHGFGASFSFANALKNNSQRWFNMVSINLPPSGKSQMVKENTLENYTKYVEKFIESKNLTNFYIVGHSMGGAIASFLASSSKVKKAVLISPLHPFASFDLNPEKITWSMPKTLEQSAKGTKNLVLDGGIWQKAGGLSFVAKKYLEFINNNWIKLHNLFYNQIASEKYLKTVLFEKYQKSSKKLFIISGKNDVYIEKQFLDKTIKTFNLPYKFLENCGHCPIFENSLKIFEILKLIVV